MAVVGSGNGTDGGVVVIEERVKSCSVDEDVFRVDNSQAPGIIASSGLAGTRSGKVWVSESRVDRERSWSTRIWLVISAKNPLAQAEFINNGLVLTVSLFE